MMLRTKSNRMADEIQSDGGRNPIGRRTESDWTADAAHYFCRTSICLLLNAPAR